ncbi:VOC family protein [Shimia aestuarii]|uniref:Glyoxalase/Bleomycin resistance protein/Dioxygenase superfamily protein n=1 Tax=Shimia aestuarii TaxID=254406 RepID=A0A1I4PAP5_9RHOB|nr:VOC family protein [Shimia aestuarii]SFM24617.1 Glyoxalase/Bleomycin resistance protein/Dioxygenase superfamily protein [Shimia aestuarii]
MKLEHVNICVPDAKSHAAVLMDLFGWKVRWEGPAKDDGYTVHVGDDESYLALYTPAWALKPEAQRYHHQAGLNHVGVVVEDLDTVEARVKAAGYMPHSHADYEPGRRFYFDGPDDVEYEVVSYD